MSDKETPSNSGKNSENQYYVSFKGLDGAPTFEIASTLTIGSSEGDAILNESISSKHCSILRNNNVLSIVDHNSVEGTFIAGRQISPGRVYLLEQADEIKLGTISAVIEVVKKSVKTVTPPHPSSNPPPLPAEEEISDFTGSFVQKDLVNDFVSENSQSLEMTEDETGDFDLSELEETKVGLKDKLFGLLSRLKRKKTEDFEDDEFEDEYEIDDQIEEDDFDSEFDDDFEQTKSWKDKIPFAAKLFRKKEDDFEEELDKTQGASTSLISLSSLRLKKTASALYRLIAVLGDFLLSVGIVNIFTFADFIEILDFGKDKLISLYSILFSKILTSILPPDLLASFDLTNMTNLSSDFIYYLLTFAMLRVLGTLLMGLSPTQFFIGLSGTENLVYNHILGALRELLGLFTGPLVIFDLPSLFQKPTLKELVTFSRVNTVSATSNFIRTILFIPVIIAFTYLSPFFRGFEDSKTYIVHYKKPFKFKEADKYYHNTELSTFMPEDNDWSYSLSVSSKMKRSKGLKKQKTLNYYLVGFHYHEKNIYSEMSLLKKFSMVELLDLYFSDSTNGAENYPNLYQLFLNSKVKKKSSSLKFSKRNQADVTNEFTSLLKEVMELDITKSVDYIIKGEYWLKGLFNFKEAFINLVDGNIDSVDVIPLKGITFLRIIHSLGVQRHETLIPMIKVGIVLRHSYKTDLPFGATQKIVLSKMLSRIKW